MRRNPALGATRHTMLGPGGRIVEPASETALLDEALQFLAHSDHGPHAHLNLRQAIDILLKLRAQVSEGYHRNPPRPKFSAGHAVRQMSDNVHEVRYVHLDDGEAYRHEFNDDVEMWAIQRGDSRDVLLTHKQGKPLWEDF